MDEKQAKKIINNRKDYTKDNVAQAVAKLKRKGICTANPMNCQKIGGCTCGV